MAPNLLFPRKGSLLLSLVIVALFSSLFSRPVLLTACRPDWARPLVDSLLVEGQEVSPCVCPTLAGCLGTQCVLPYCGATSAFCDAFAGADPLAGAFAAASGFCDAFAGASAFCDAFAGAFAAATSAFCEALAVGGGWSALYKEPKRLQIVLKFCDRCVGLRQKLCGGWVRLLQLIPHGLHLSDTRCEPRAVLLSHGPWNLG